MLEIRPYEGSPEELSKFVVAQWTASYGGDMAVPRWSGDYFRWQLRMDEPCSVEYLIAAYDGVRLAGVVPFFPSQFSIDGECFSASQASWLSVAPEFRGQAVGGKMIQTSQALHRELGLRFQTRVCLLRSSTISRTKVLAPIAKQDNVSNPSGRFLGTGTRHETGSRLEPQFH